LYGGRFHIAVTPAASRPVTGLVANAWLMPAASTTGVRPVYDGMVYVTVDPPGSRLLPGQAAAATVTTGGGGGEGGVGLGGGGGGGLGPGGGEGGGGKSSLAVLMQVEAHNAPAAVVVSCGVPELLVR
jgi:hypothetical protein